MNIDCYGFREPPFQMTPDARLFYASTVHSRAYAHLIYGLTQREGFIVVTGEVGAGKTTLIERLCAELDPAQYAVARISTTLVSGDDLLRLVADSFGLPADSDKAGLLRAIVAYLRSDPRRHLLIVDEAQALAELALEELRMLSNIADGNRALLQIMLLGQPQLRQVISSAGLDQLRQRILASFHLSGLSSEETRAYVEHRMRAVGWQGTPVWEEGTFELVHRHTDGVHRRINRLCSRVLLSGALDRTERLTVPMIEATAVELEEDLGAGIQSARGAVRGYRPSHRLPTLEMEGRLEELTHRIKELERAFVKRERIFQRLMDLFGGGGVDR